MRQDNDFLTVPTQGAPISERELREEEKDSQRKKPNLWDVLAERKRKGLWDGEIERVTIKEYNLSDLPHFFVLDNKKREVKCTNCPIEHGGILEAKLLSRYEIK